MSAPRTADESPLAAVRASEPFAAIDLGTTYAKSLIAQRGPALTWNTAGASAVCYTSRQLADDSALQNDRFAAAGEALRLAGERAISLSGRAAHVSTCVMAVPMAAVTLCKGQAEVSRTASSTAVDEAEAIALAQQAAMAAVRRRDRASRQAWLGPVWTRWSVDGRHVTSPLGFVAHQLGVEATHALAASESVAALHRWGDSQGLTVLPLPEALAFAELLRGRRPCLVLDAGGQRCDLYLRSRDGALHWHGVPLGGHYFTRVLCAGAAMSPARAERVKLAYSNERLRARSRLRVGAMMRRAAVVWYTRMGEALASLPEPLPGLWLASGGHSSLPECSRLPASYADASMSRLESHPRLEPLAYGETGLPLVPGPEVLLPSHAVCFGLAQWVARLAEDEHSLSHLRRLALAAAREGHEVSSAWLTL